MKYEHAAIASLILELVIMGIRLIVVMYHGLSISQYLLGCLLSLLFMGLIWVVIYYNIKICTVIYNESFSFIAILQQWAPIVVATLVGILLFFEHIGEGNSLILYVGAAMTPTILFGLAASSDV